MPSFQEVGIEGFQRYPHSRFHYIQGVLSSGGWNKGVSLYTEVSSFQGVGTKQGFNVYIQIF